MKHFYSLSKLLLLLAGLFFTWSATSQDSLKILTGEIELDPGETVAVEAEYTDTAGVVQDVNINWHAEPGYLGRVDRDGVLTAKHPGEGMLFAKYRGLKDSVRFVVTGEPKGGDDDDDGGEEIDYPKVKVIPGMIRVAAGDSVELVAFYVNDMDEKVDTSFTWSVWPPELGEFPDSSKSMFYAGETGEGMISATLGDLSDTVKLVVGEPKGKHNQSNSGRNMVITPGDTTVNAGDLPELQYYADYKMNGQKHENAEIAWSTSGDSIGSIDSTGLFVFNGETGLALVTAAFSNFSASVELLVVDSLADTEVNTITIHRVLPDGNELPAKSFMEGEAYKIGGLPFPLNLLNGGMLHFPFGSISEDITIYMFIPEEYAEIDSASYEVAFEEEIITGVKFNVKPDGSDTIVEPYHFDVPLTLALVYKKDLLDSLGISPENLDVFFAENTEFVTDSAGVVAIDTTKNKIYASILHFSTIVVRQKSQQTFAEITDDSSEETMMVYPNPFSRSTKIEFEIGRQSDVRIEVYNLYGQKVKTLVNETKFKGIHSVNWDGKNDQGRLLSSGMYFCRMVTDGNQSEVKRIILNR